MRLSRSDEVVLPAAAAADHHRHSSRSPPGHTDVLYSSAASVTEGVSAAVSPPSLAAAAASSKAADSSRTKDSLDLTDRQKINFILQKFEEIDLDGSGEINKLEFRQFLDNLNVFLSREKFNLLWRAVDENLSDSISEDEVWLLSFEHLILPTLVYCLSSYLYINKIILYYLY
jgi:hypothetical protein